MKCPCCTNLKFLQNTDQRKRQKPVSQKDFLVAPVINFGNTVQNGTGGKIFCLLASSILFFHNKDKQSQGSYHLST